MNGYFSAMRYDCATAAAKLYAEAADHIERAYRLIDEATDEEHTNEGHAVLHLIEEHDPVGLLKKAADRALETAQEQRIRR